MPLDVSVTTKETQSWVETEVVETNVCTVETSSTEYTSIRNQKLQDSSMAELVALEKSNGRDGVLKAMHEGQDDVAVMYREEKVAYEVKYIEKLFRRGWGKDQMCKELENGYDWLLAAAVAERRVLDFITDALRNCLTLAADPANAEPLTSQLAINWLTRLICVREKDMRNHEMSKKKILSVLAALESELNGGYISRDVKVVQAELAARKDELQKCQVQIDSCTNARQMLQVALDVANNRHRINLDSSKNGPAQKQAEYLCNLTIFLSTIFQGKTEEEKVQQPAPPPPPKPHKRHNYYTVVALGLSSK